MQHERGNRQVLGYFNYGYDGHNSDSLVSDFVEGDGSVVTYNYDAVSRLTSEQRQFTYPYLVNYSYDAAGNRLTRVWNNQQTNYQYDAADRLLGYIKPDGSQVIYGWDANGNMTTRSVVSGQSSVVTSFAYDYDNHLVKITYPDGSVIQFGYDGLGRRVWRQDNLGTRYFFYDGDKIIAEREGNSWVVRHLLALQPCGFVTGGAVRIYHSDRLGSVRWVTDASQNIIVGYTYEGFGKIVGQNGGGGGPYQFCGLWGYRNDQDAGLLHVGARYYEPEAGRFVQKDPWLGIIMSPMTLNRYLYCLSNPINAIDPSGYEVVTGALLIVGAISIIAVAVGVYVWYKSKLLAW